MSKLISFSPWFGGFNNVRMSYELAGCISYLTNRTLVLPPKIYVCFLSKWQEKDTYFDIWDIFDKKAFTKQFNCIDYKDTPLAELENDTQYFEGIDKISKLVYPKGKIKFKQYGAMKDFTPPIPIEFSDNHIHYPRVLFGSPFEYLTMTDEQSVILKDKLKNGLKIKRVHKNKANKYISKLGYYNAVHIRQTDFLDVNKQSSQTQVDTLINDIKWLINADKPLYIATDENNRDKFKSLIDAGYEIHFVDTKLKDYEQLVQDILMCTNADCFLGSKNSTYSNYIHILRGYDGKQDFSKYYTNGEYGDNRGWFRTDTRYWK